MAKQTFLQRYVFWIIYGVALTFVSTVLIYLTYTQTHIKHGPFAHMGGDFTLQSKDGPVALKDFRGKVVVLYFGYTSCPDVCPTEMALLGNAVKKLPKAEQDQVQVLFIGVDPERDKLPLLKNYAKFFYPTFIGVTGSPDKLASIAGAYGAFYEKVPMKNSALGYSIDHSSYFYVIDQSGQLVRTISHSNSVDAVVNGLRPYLEPKQQS